MVLEVSGYFVEVCEGDSPVWRAFSMSSESGERVRRWISLGSFGGNHHANAAIKEFLAGDPAPLFPLLLREVLADLVHLGVDEGEALGSARLLFPHRLPKWH